MKITFEEFAARFLVQQADAICESNFQDNTIRYTLEAAELAYEALENKVKERNSAQSKGKNASKP